MKEEKHSEDEGEKEENFMREWENAEKEEEKEKK